jgi:hypothetical protein
MRKMKTIITAMCSLSLLAWSAPRATAKDTADREEYRLGHPFTLGDYTYIVTKFEAKRKIGGKYHTKEAEHGGKFLVVY